MAYVLGERSGQVAAPHTSYSIDKGLKIKFLPTFCRFVASVEEIVV